MMMVSVALPGQHAFTYFHHLTVEDGLTQGTNHFVYKDSKGFIWLSSLSGLNRYDGREVKPYRYNPDDSTSVYGQFVQSPFFETADQNIWFSSFDGLNCYDRKQNKFRHFILKNENGGQVYNLYLFHLDDQGNLWITADGNMLYHFHIPTEKFKWKHDLPQEFLRAVPIAGEGNSVEKVMYLGHQTPGILIVDYENGEKGNSVFRFGNNAANPLLIRKTIQEGDKIWMATSIGLVLYDPVSGQTEFFYSSPDVNLETCNSLARYSDDKIYVAIKGKGVFVFDTKLRKFVTQYTASASNAHSLPNNNPDVISIDSDGCVWISFDNYGVVFFHPRKQKFETLKPDVAVSENKLSFDIRSMIEDENGKIWCGTYLGGIAIYDVNDKTFTWRKNTDNPAHPDILTNITKLFRDSKNRIWVLGWQGISVWLPDKKKLIALTDIKDIYLDICQLKNGKIMLAAYRGGMFELQELPGNKFRVKEIRQVDGKMPFVSMWEDRNGRLFACAELKEIWVFEPDQNFRLIQKIPLQGTSVSFCERPGDPSVWIANSYGLARLALNNGKYDYTLFTEKDGLATSVTNSIQSDNAGRLWIGTGKGIASFDPKKVSFTNYGIADGISASQFNAFATLKRRDGQLMFGSSNGITAFYPKAVKPLDVTAHPVITNILINDQADTSIYCKETGATNASEIESLQLDYQRNTISFSFAALEYSHPDATKFRYKLEGVDPAWVDIGNENFARYAKIPPGNYVFSVQASNSDGIWSDDRNISIYIEPPFTKTLPFYILVALGVISFIGAVMLVRYRRRVRIMQMKEEKRLALEFERQRIARDVHDDLGSGLSALSLLTEIAKYKNSKEELKGEIEKINNASRELSGKIREVIWTVNAKNDTLANLISYMNMYALELFDNAGIDYHVDLPDPIPELTISGEYRRTLFLGFKEALNNTLKHAKATKVAIDFFADANYLRIAVKDNGIGFDPKLLVDSTGNGLLNMQSRMRDMHGDCQFKTGPTGTQVVFTLKVNMQTR
jgi:signal transduction histidine kinase/ligand-binding sensor domain-containing protein